MARQPTGRGGGSPSGALVATRTRRPGPHPRGCAPEGGAGRSSRRTSGVPGCDATDGPAWLAADCWTVRADPSGVRDRRGGTEPQAILAVVAPTAWRMSRVPASGCDTIEAWEADTSWILAFARSAMNRWSAAGIALSSVQSRYQDGRVFQAGGPDGSLNAAPVHGRCAAAMTSDVPRSTSAAKAAWNCSMSR